MMSDRLTRTLPWLPALLMSLAAGLHTLRVPLLGDDMILGIFYPSKYPVYRLMGGTFLHSNARFWDITSSFWLSVCPRALLALLCALMVLLMLWGLKQLSGVSSRQPGRLALLFTLAFMALPWANSLDPIVVQLNYIWALAFLLLTLWLIFTRPMSSRRWLWYLPVAFVSGCGHEIIGLPVLIGLLVWLTCVRTSPLSPVKKWILAALALGCIFSVSSPGSYARLLSMESPGIQVPVWQHLITAAWLGWLLLLDFALLAIFRRSRLKQLCHTLWSPLAAISIASMVFLPVSYVPRAGIAVQLFALAAFARQFDFQLSRATSCLCAWALSLLMALQWSGAILWQWRVDTGTRLIMQEFHSNPRRPISGSFTTEVPCWLGGKATSNPIVCIPWNQACISRTYGFPILLQPCPANKEQGLQPCPEK